MRGFGTLLLAFFLSGFVAGGVQLQLGVLLEADLGLALALLTLLPMLGGALPGRQELAIMLEISMPIAIMIVIQWWLVRRAQRPPA